LALITKSRFGVPYACQRFDRVPRSHRNSLGPLGASATRSPASRPPMPRRRNGAPKPSGSGAFRRSVSRAPKSLIYRA